MTDAIRKAAQDLITEWDGPTKVGTWSPLMEALRAALQQPAPDDAVCEWTEGGDMWDGACKKAFFTHGDYEPPNKYMKFCYGCGKRIRFIDGENNGS